MSSFVPYGVYGIVGYPLGHSLSPLLHTTAFAELGIPAVLVPWPTPPERLGSFVEAVRLLGVRGACVTIPHKEAIIPLLDGATDRARSAGAVNLLVWKGAELWGDNTDVPGFVAPLRAAAVPASISALVLGAGGAARAAVCGLKEYGFSRIAVSNGTEARARALAADFGLDTVPWDRRAEHQADLVVNATPLGMKGKHEGETPYPAEAFAGRRGIAYDIVYTPLATRFLSEAAAAGWGTIDGRAMFIAQADEQFAAWTGRRLPEAAIRAVSEALGD